MNPVRIPYTASDGQFLWIELPPGSTLSRDRINVLQHVAEQILPQIHCQQQAYLPPQTFMPQQFLHMNLGSESPQGVPALSPEFALSQSPLTSAGSEFQSASPDERDLFNWFEKVDPVELDQVIADISASAGSETSTSSLMQTPIPQTFYGPPSFASEIPRPASETPSSLFEESSRASGATPSLDPESKPIHSKQRNGRNYLCPQEGCDKRYAKSYHCVAHILLHTGERPYECKELGCNESFTRSDILARHVLKHSGERNHVCRHCGKDFGRVDHIKTHVITHCEKKNQRARARIRVSKEDGINTYGLASWKEGK